MDLTKLSFFRKYSLVRFIPVNAFTNAIMFKSNSPSDGLLLLFSSRLNPSPNPKVFIDNDDRKLLPLLFSDERLLLLKFSNSCYLRLLILIFYLNNLKLLNFIFWLPSTIALIVISIMLLKFNTIKHCTRYPKYKSIFSI